ncbi:MAG: hypothetical protein PXZ07_04780 [Candidatus Eremiobacteraeota bacterium]|nr:hypothetical protein [Candidatus Eremiobacteraeota bacterium]
MNDTSLDLAARLARLEREVARTRAIALSAVVALVATLAIGAAAIHPPAALSHSALTVRDSAGHIRARLDIDGVHLYGADGRERILLGLNENGAPALHLNDAVGTTRYSTFLDPKSGYATTRFLSSSSQSLATLAGVEEPYLRFYDKANSWRVYLGISTSHDAILNLSNGSGHLAAEMIGGTNPRFSLYTGSTENERASLAVNSGNASVLALNNSTGSNRALLDGGTSPRLTLFTGSGIKRVYLGMSLQGHPVLDLRNHLGGKGYALTVNDGAYMHLYDGSSAERGYFGIYANGTSGVAIYNADHSLHWSSP